MKTGITLLILCFLGYTALATDTSMVKLMQKIIDTEVDKEYRFFYLFDKAAIPDFNENTVKEISQSHPKDIPAFVLTELLSAVKSDTLPFKWSEHRLPRAKYFDNKHLPKFPSLSRYAKGMPNVDSLGRLTKSTEPIDYRAREQASRYAFSKPVFSTDKQYALITTGLGDSGACYILKLTSGVWQIVYHSRWQS